MSDDHFSDVRGLLGGLGSSSCFQGTGLDQHNTTSTRMSSDKRGMDITVRCDNCGTTNCIGLEWDEFIYGACAAVAPNWKYDRAHRALYPNVGCKGCKELIMLTFNPHECERHLQTGIAAGALPAAYVANGKQKVMATKQRTR